MFGTYCCYVNQLTHSSNTNTLKNWLKARFRVKLSQRNWWVRRHGAGHVAIVVFLRIHCWAQFNYAEHNNNIKWKQPHRSISNVIECLCGLCIAICDGHSPEHITESICIHGEWTLLCGVMGHTMIDNDRHITPNSIIAVYVCFGQILICNSGTVQHSATVIHTFLWYCTITVAAVK